MVDEQGRILGQAYEEVALRSPKPGWVEQDLDEIEASAHRTLRQALEEAGRPEEVGGLAFSGQMSGIGTIDADFRPRLAISPVDRLQPMLTRWSRRCSRSSSCSRVS